MKNTAAFFNDHAGPPMAEITDINFPKGVTGVTSPYPTAHFKEWVTEHTEAHERAEYERTLRYNVYYFFAHFQGGLFGMLLLVVKVESLH